MNEVYILIITRESTETYTGVAVFPYSTMEGALKAYDVSVDEARNEAESFVMPSEDREIANESYRFFRIEDLHTATAITIEVVTKEIIGDDADDI